MGVVAEMADHVMVMYAGKSVEYGTAEDIFDHPMHPYTVDCKAIPKLGVVRKIICLRSRERFRGWMRCRPDADFYAMSICNGAVQKRRPGNAGRSRTFCTMLPVYGSRDTG